MSDKPLLFDTFCGGGGCSVGYDRAGFRVVGCDNRPQRHYPFDFVQADALDLLRRLIDGQAVTFASGQAYKLSDFDAIHASPPCQKYTRAQCIQHRQHPDLIAPMRELLDATSLPYVIENVPGAPLRIDLLLCGSMFNLRWRDLLLYRHRIFEGGRFSLSPFVPATCCHDSPAISVFGHTVLGASKNGMTYKHPNEREHLGVAVGREVMGIDWMTRDELSEAIPPVYCKFVGSKLMAHLEAPQ